MAEGFWQRQWVRILRLVRPVAQLRISVYAAHTAFFLVLSLFPSLVLLLGLLRRTGLDVNGLTRLLEGLIPQALMPAARKLILTTYRSTSGMVLSLSAVTALWSAGRGIYGLLLGLNRVYDVRETRGYLYTRLLCAGYTFSFLLVLLLTLLVHVFGSGFFQWLQTRLGTLSDFWTDVVDLRFFLLLGAQTLLFSILYRVLPNRPGRFRESLPGALLASAGWLLFSQVYSVYARYFTGYANIYGSVYVVALSMLWLYCCVSIVLYGGALNRLLAENPKGNF